MFHFFFQALIEWGFLELLENESGERKVKRIFLLYWDKKTMAAVLIKSSVYAGFKMSWSMVYSHSYRFFELFFCFLEEEEDNL